MVLLCLHFTVDAPELRPGTDCHRSHVKLKSQEVELDDGTYQLQYLRNKKAISSSVISNGSQNESRISSSSP